MKTAPAVPEKCSFKKIGLMLQCPVLQKDNPGRTESPAGILYFGLLPPCYLVFQKKMRFF